MSSEWCSLVHQGDVSHVDCVILVMFGHVTQTMCIDDQRVVCFIIRWFYDIQVMYHIRKYVMLWCIHYFNLCHPRGVSIQNEGLLVVHVAYLKIIVNLSHPSKLSNRNTGVQVTQVMVLKRICLTSEVFSQNKVTSSRPSDAHQKNILF